MYWYFKNGSPSFANGCGANHPFFNVTIERGLRRKIYTDYKAIPDYADTRWLRVNMGRKYDG